MSKKYINRPVYIKGLFTGVVLVLAWQILIHYAQDLFFYYQTLGLGTADSIEAGPIKITLSNATDWSTVFKMILVILATYAGIRAINKYI